MYFPNWVVGCCVKARGHLVADLDPLGIVYADLHSSYEQRGESPSSVVVRDHMLGNCCLCWLLYTTLSNQAAYYVKY